MAYIKANINKYGTEEDLLNAIGDFFENNTLCRFTVSRQFDEYPHYIYADYENIRLEFRGVESAGASASAIIACLNMKIADSDSYTTINSASISVATANLPPSYINAKEINILLWFCGNSVCVAINGYNRPPERPTMLLFKSRLMTVGETIYYLNTSSWRDSNNAASYTIYPLHCPPNDTSKLLLEKNAAVNNATMNTYVDNIENAGIIIGTGIAQGTYYNIGGNVYLPIVSVATNRLLSIAMGEEVTYNADN